MYMCNVLQMYIYWYFCCFACIICFGIKGIDVLSIIFTFTYGYTSYTLLEIYIRKVSVLVWTSKIAFEDVFMIGNTELYSHVVDVVNKQ